MKLFWRYRDAFLFLGGMWDVFEIKSGTRDQSGQKWQVNMTSARYLLLLLPTRQPSPEARLSRRQSIEPYENGRKILNFCVTDFFPYLALSSTPYLGSDVTLLAFVPSVRVLSKRLKIKETNTLMYTSYSTKIVRERQRCVINNH